MLMEQQTAASHFVPAVSYNFKDPDIAIKTAIVSYELLSSICNNISQLSICKKINTLEPRARFKIIKT